MKLKRSKIADKQVIIAVCKSVGDGMKISPFQLLVDETGFPPKVVLAAIRRCYKRGFINYGDPSQQVIVTAKGFLVGLCEG